MKLRPIWSHLLNGANRYPIERTDLLDRLKLFGDVHRASRFGLEGHVTPIVDITPLREQVPLFYSVLQQAAGAAGTFAAVTLGSGNFIGRLARPLVVGVSTLTVGRLWYSHKAHPGLAGAPTAPANAEGFEDTRRGLPDGPLAGQQAVFHLNSSANVGNVPGTNVHFLDLDTINRTFYIPETILANMILAPGVDLYMSRREAVTDLQVFAVWSEEPSVAATRTVLG